MADTIALIGNPNTGKSSLFNSLTTTHAHVGNWSGVTVDKKLGKLKGANTTVIDLPGVYSLDPLAKDEAVVADYLMHNEPNLILNITNANQLKRNLMLSLDILELGYPVILVLNMIDSLHRTGRQYNLSILKDNLGCKIIATNARGHYGIKDLRNEIVKRGDFKEGPLKIAYPEIVQQAIRQVARDLVKKFGFTLQKATWLSIQYMNKNKYVRKYAESHHLTPLLEQTEYYDRQDFNNKILTRRLEFINKLLAEAVERVNGVNDIEISNQIDRVVTNPILGVLIFILILFLMFKLSFDWVGTPLSDYFDSFISGPLSNTFDNWLIQVGAIPALRSLIVNGIIAGVGGILAFIPQIFMLFACIAILEDTGYMARAALTMDRLMQVFGLNGKAFIPLIIGFGCNATGVMATRTIEQPKERLVTTLIMPFMSCSARLPIYALVTAAVFPQNQALIMLGLYLLGIFVALFMAKVYEVLFKVKENSTFVIEMPDYHVPRLDVLFHSTWENGKGFIKKAGTIIFAGTVFIWLLSNFGPAGFITNSSGSFAAIIGRCLVPIFAPIGITSWQIISSLFTGVLAKEVITSSMMVMFHTSSQAVLVANLTQFISPTTGLALLTFILLYSPCTATLATVKQETGSNKWMIYSLLSSTLIAYIVAFIVFKLSSLII